MLVKYWHINYYSEGGDCLWDLFLNQVKITVQGQEFWWVLLLNFFTLNIAKELPDSRKNPIAKTPELHKPPQSQNAALGGKSRVHGQHPVEAVGLPHTQPRCFCTCTEVVLNPVTTTCTEGVRKCKGLQSECVW